MRRGADMRLPGARTKEQDAVAMLDEGGVVLFFAPGTRTGAAPARTAIFGHAIYEALASGGATKVGAAAVAVEVDTVEADGRTLVRAADAALAELLSGESPIGRAHFEAFEIEERAAQLPRSERL